MEIEHWQSILEDIPAWALYVFLAFSALVENLFPPWPGDTMTVLGGVLAAQGRGNIYLCFLSVFLGNIAGACFMYWAGRPMILFLQKVYHAKGKAHVFWGFLLRPLCESEELEKTKERFRKWGLLFVLFSRFSAGIRFFVSIIAGMTSLPFLSFLLAFSAGLFLWNVPLLWGGLVLGANWTQFISWLKLYNGLVLALLLCLGAFVIYWKFRASKKQKSA